jgi:PAS domain S-box-containing protein
MNPDHPGTKKELLVALESARQRIAELEAEEKLPALSGASILEEAWGKLEFIANITRDAISLIDGNYVYRNANSAYRHALAPERLIGRTVEQVWGTETFHKAIKPVLDRCFAGEVVHYQATFPFHGKGRGYFNVSYYPYSDREGKVTHAVVITRDITENKRTEEAFRESEEKFRSLFENAPIGIFRSTLEGRFLAINPEGARMFGYDSPEHIMAEVTDIPTQFYADPAYRTEFMRLVAERGVVRDFEFEARHRSGAHIPCSISAWPLRDPAGTMVGYDGFITDVTDRKAMEARSLLAQKLESLGGLSTGMAHEINNPSQCIRSNVEFLQKGVETLVDVNALLLSCLEMLRRDHRDETFSERYAEISSKANLDYLVQELPKSIRDCLDGVERISGIVDSLRYFAGQEEGKRTLVDLNRAVESALTLTRHTWKDYTEFALDLDRDLPTVSAVGGELNQALLNILLNAAQAIAGKVGPSPEKKGKIGVRTRYEDGWAEIRISDTGPGIPKELWPRIYDPFFTTRDVGMGRGQGLAVARTIVVTRHGGSIDFETEPGKGTTFVIRLPLGSQNVF